MRQRLLRYMRGFAQLSRPDPTASWAGGAFVIGAAFAFQNVGSGLLWHDGVIALVGVVAALSFGAHGLNDAYDWYTGTDRSSIGAGTGGSRVIPDGVLSMRETLAVGFAGLLVTLAVGAYFYLVYGWPIVVLTAIGVGAPIAYSLPPLKLAYRPFAEVIVALPALTGITLGSELVLSGSMTWAGLVAGLVHAGFSISWFVVSRVPDYHPDRRVGKTTSVVFLGRERARALAAIYLLGSVGLAVAGFALVGWPFAVSLGFGVFMFLGLRKLDPFDPKQASAIRYRQMRSSTAHAIVLAAAITVAGVSVP